MKPAPLFAALLAAAVTGAAAAAEAPPPARPAPVRLITPASASEARSVAATVVAASHATVSTRLAAAVRSVHAEEGDRVAAGQLLVVLADDDLQAQLRAAKAMLGLARAQERRLVALQAQRAATGVELEQAQGQLAQADAAVRGVEAQLAYARIRAPFAGVVQARRVSAGDLVGPGAPLYELEGAGLELVASLEESEARGLHVKDKLAFTLDGAAGCRAPPAAGARDASCGEAEIVALVPGGDPVSHRSGLRARVRSAPEGLRTGAFARLVLPGATGGAPGLWVPRTALVQRGDLTGVFVAEDGVATLRWLALARSESERVRVLAGLSDGARVIRDPAGLRDGQRVEVLP